MGKLEPAKSTRAHIRPGGPIHAIDRPIVSLQEPIASHLAMLNAVAGTRIVSEAYAVTTRHGYLRREFGESHLLQPKENRKLRLPEIS